MTLPERLRDVRVSIGLEWDAQHRAYVFDTTSKAAERIDALEDALRRIASVGPAITRQELIDFARGALDGTLPKSANIGSNAQTKDKRPPETPVK